MILLTDGSVMAQSAGVSSKWYKLTPSSTGSYVDGTWSTIAPMNLQRLYYASEVLKDGRVLVLGGEYSGPTGASNDSNAGEIYDPVANTWTNIATFPQAKFGDDPTELLPDGRVLAGYILGPQTYIYDPVSNTWSNGPTKLYNDRSDEENWVKLPDGSILSYDIFGNAQHAQRYVPSLNQWVDAGAVPVQLQSSISELGPAVLLPDGRVFQIGATSHNAIYTPPTTLTGTGSWVAAPDTPGGIGGNDVPAAIMPNGKVLYAAGDTSGSYSPPTTLFEYDPVANVLTPAPTTGGPGLNVAPFTTRMLMLPNGQVLMNPDSNHLYVYTPDGSPNPAWAPTITNVVNNNDGTFTLSGLQLNGMSEGAMYGDDAEMSSNYPIIRLTDASGTVKFARTFNFSSTGVATGALPVTTQFTLPSGVSPNAFLFSVSASGITSPTYLDVQLGGSTTDNVSLRSDPNDATKLQILAGDSVLTSYPYSSFSGVIITGDSAGDTISVDGNFSGMPLIIDGGAGDNVINVSAFGSTTTINGADGGDTITLNFASGAPNGTINVSGGDGNDTLKVVGGNASETATLTGAQLSFESATINYNAIEGMELDTSDGDDTLNIDTPLPFTPTFAGSSGSATLNVNAGNFVFNTDAGISSQNLSVNVNAGSVLFNASQHLAALNINGGAVAMAPNGELVLVAKDFSVSNSGTLDLANNSMIVDSPASSIGAALASGSNGGAWNGPGIDSSTAANDTNHQTALGYAEASDLALNTFAGQSLDDSAVVIKYTYYGDNDLNGKVDLNDFSILVDGLNGAGSGWVYGDYDYNGVVDLTDYSSFLNIYKMQLPVI